MVFTIKKTPRKPGRPPAAEKTNAREALLKAAEAVITEQGIERLTIRAVADRAGVGAALVNYYFGNKIGLKEAIVEDTANRVRQSLLPVLEESEDYFEKLENLIVHLIRGIAGTPYTARLVVELVLTGDDAMAEKLAATIAAPSLAIISALLQEGVKEKLIREVELTLFLPSLMGSVVYPFVMARFINKLLALDLTKEEDVERYARHTAKIYLAGLKI